MKEDRSKTQKPFQPTSTSISFPHRFMVCFWDDIFKLIFRCKWLQRYNSIGIVRSYNDATDSAIDVEFHDVTHHHAIHVNNDSNFTMADLSEKSLVLGSADKRWFVPGCWSFISSLFTAVDWSVWSFHLGMLIKIGMLIFLMKNRSQL